MEKASAHYWFEWITTCRKRHHCQLSVFLQAAPQQLLCKNVHHTHTVHSDGTPDFPWICASCAQTHSPGPAAWSLRNSKGHNMGFLHPRGVCSHDENGRAGSGGEHLVLMSWPRERGHSQIPGHVFFFLQEASPTVSCTLFWKYVRTSRLISKSFLIHYRHSAHTEWVDHTGKNSWSWKTTVKNNEKKNPPHPHHSHSGELHNQWVWKRKLVKVQRTTLKCTMH